MIKYELNVTTIIIVCDCPTCTKQSNSKTQEITHVVGSSYDDCMSILYNLGWTRPETIYGGRPSKKLWFAPDHRPENSVIARLRYGLPLPDGTEKNNYNPSNIQAAGGRYWCIYASNTSEKGLEMCDTCIFHFSQTYPINSCLKEYSERFKSTRKDKKDNYEPTITIKDNGKAWCKWISPESEEGIKMCNTCEIPSHETCLRKVK